MNNKNQYTKSEQGNALIYVLIAIVLFAALGFTLARHTSNSDISELEEAHADIHALEIISYASQAKSIVDQMIFSGSNLNNINLTLPSEAGFSTAPYVHKVYHPQGGGLTPANLPANAINEISSPPAAGWHMGQVNSVGWTGSTATDVILTAHQITKLTCEALNKKITGSKTIPALTGNLDDYLVDSATDLELTNVVCAACEGYMSLCVSNAGVTTYSFYNVLADR